MTTSPRPSRPAVEETAPHLRELRRRELVEAGRRDAYLALRETVQRLTTLLAVVRAQRCPHCGKAPAEPVAPSIPAQRQPSPEEMLRPRVITDELRARARPFLDDGLGYKRLAKALHVDLATARRLCDEYRAGAVDRHLEQLRRGVIPTVPPPDRRTP